MKIKNGSHEAIFDSRKNGSSVRKNLNTNNNKQTNVKSTSSKSKLKRPPVDNPEAHINVPYKPPSPQQPTVIVKSEDHEKSLPAKEVSKELLRIQGSWLFDLAPDELIIEDKRLILKRNYFPVGGSIITLPLNKLSVFEVNIAFFYAALYIKGDGNVVNTVMQWLHPKDAVRAKEVVDGLLLKEAEKIEIKADSKEKEVEVLQSLGHT